MGANQLKITIMTRLETIIAVAIVAVAVAVFFALISYLGGYGAIISAILVAAFGCDWTEKTTDKSNN